MTFFGRQNGLDPALDIIGSLTYSQSMTLADEPNGLGQKTGTSITDGVLTASSNTLASSTITTSNVQIGQWVSLGGLNAGTFLVTDVATGSATIYPGVVTLVDDTVVAATFRQPYSLQDDLNYSRSDRKAIKGTANWYDATPSITNADGTTTVGTIANLAAVATSAQNVVLSIQALASVITPAPFTVGQAGAQIAITSAQFCTTTNKVGLPLFDGGAGVLGNTDFETSYVIITDPTTGNEIRPTGATDSLLFGVLVKGAVTGGTDVAAAVSGTSVNVKFYKTVGSNLSSAVPYVLTAADIAAHPAIDMAIPQSYRLDQVPSNAFRRILTLGLMSDADIRNDIDNLQTLTGIPDEQTKILATNITNTGANYPLNLTSIGTGISQLGAFNDLNDAQEALITAIGATLGQTDMSSGSTVFTNNSSGYPIYDGNGSGAASTTVLAAINALNKKLYDLEQSAGSATFTNNVAGYEIYDNNGGAASATTSEAIDALNLGAHNINTALGMLSTATTMVTALGTASSVTGSPLAATGATNTNVTALTALNTSTYDMLTAAGLTINSTTVPSYTHTGNYYPLSVSGATSTLHSAIDALNESINNLTFSGPGNTILNGTPGTYTVTSALQALADGLANSLVVRVIERITGSPIAANATHQIPAALGTYTPDSYGNGLGLWVFVRGVLKDPGTIGSGDDYAELEGTGTGHSSTKFTAVKFFTQVKVGDHVNYFKRG